MAKYEITMSCGHDETRQIYGTNVRGQREHRAEQLAKGPCETCRTATRAQVDERATEVAAAEGWPTLTGSPKQSTWAETIRADAMAQLADDAGRQARRAESAGWTPEQAQELASLLYRIWQRTALGQTDATWWINNRDNISRAVIESLTEADRAEHKAGVDAIVAKRDAPVEAEADVVEDEQVIETTQMDMTQAHMRERLVDALNEAGQRAADAELARAAAIAEIGELLRLDQAAGKLVGIVYAEWITKLSRPTLTKARADADAWRELAEIAAGADASSDDHGHETALHARLPYLAGWHRAAEYVQRKHVDAYWAERGGFDPWETTDGSGQAPGYRALMDLYDRRVRAYAEGEPAYLAQLRRHDRGIVD